MKASKRPWTRAEKLLFATPLMVAVVAGGLWVWQRMAPFSVVVSGTRSLNDMNFSPDGTRLLVTFNDNQNPSRVGVIYDVARRRKICDLLTPPATASPNPLFPPQKPFLVQPSWSPDGRRIAAGYVDGSRSTIKIPEYSSTDNSSGFRYGQIGKVALWNAQTGRVMRNFLYAPFNEVSYAGVRYSSDGQRLIGWNTPPAIFDAATGTRIQAVKGSFKQVNQGRFNDKMGLWALRDEDRTHIQVFDSMRQRVLWQTKIGMVDEFMWRGPVLGFIDEARVGSGRRGANRLVLWDAQTRSILPTPPQPLGSFSNNLALNSDMRTLAYFNGHLHTPPKTSSRAKATVTGHLIVWDYRAHRELWRVPIETIPMWVQWSPDGQWLSTVTDSTSVPPATLRIFDRAGVLRIEEKVLNYMHRWSPDSRSVVVISSITASGVRLRSIRVGS